MAIPCAPARVVATRRVTPNMLRIRFEADGDWRWPVHGRGDERVDIALPAPGETRAAIEVFNLPEYGRGWTGEEPPWRHYTVRSVHEGGRFLDIDFVVHDGGLASAWAERAEPGHVIGIFGAGTRDEPSSYYAAPADADFQLLVADATGVPGLGRIIEQLPAGARALAIAEVPSEADIQEFETRGDVELIWKVGTGNGYRPSALAAEVARVTDPGVPWYAWVACEAATSRSIRRDLRSRLGLARDRHHAIGYWTQDRTGNMSADVG
ncbi:siderophore-interacting protein [Leucobacter chromiireducens]|uniref:Siderophore-interacting protein n=1 Tax=Leucobacter chromiireducens subsp. solipictus TaxID=398235 RepID=A0ABS1SDK5_9MICO|nr:siderophore-interacting protein [Leucobacter chromiireducens]MBL3678016.1 siderophore-interacting protein [Leucobacter chromiireducens subsp. solipictus]